MNRILVTICFLCACLQVLGQNIPLYNWRSHVPYLQGKQVLEVGSRIYCMTQTGLFYYDISDNSMHPLSKVDGFSEISVQTIAYAPKHDILFIVYQDGNMDLVHAGKITNHPDFLNFTVNGIYIDPNEDKAYFAVSSSNINYGISEWDIADAQINGNAYNPNQLPNIYRVATLGDSLYECSAYGVKKVNLNSDKVTPSNWENISSDSCGSIVSFDGRIVGAFQGGILKYYNGLSNTWIVLHHDPFVLSAHRIQSIESVNGQLVELTDNTVYTYQTLPVVSDSFAIIGNDAIVDERGTVWIAQDEYVLLSHSLGAPPAQFGFFGPGGFPSTTLGFHAYGYKNQIWVSAGVITSSGAPGYDNHGFYMYDGQTWHNYNQLTNYGKDPTGNSSGPDIRDFMGMAIDSVTGHLWIGALDSGIMEYDPVSHNILGIYNAANTGNTLKTIDPAMKRKYVPAVDVRFDQNDNLWVANHNTYELPIQQIVEKRHNGGWVSITAGSMNNVYSLVVDNYGGVWLMDSRDNTGVVVTNPSLGKTVTLTTTAGSGGLPSAYVNCGVNDKNGEIWLGTTAGPCVYSDPSLLFGNTKYDVQRPYINSGNNAGYLLSALNVTAIAVDGADRKWFGTNDGVWLTSPEGDKILKHFDMSNSPLISNQINAIAINGVTGEAFFVTDKGIISYRDAATDGGDQNEGVYAFPNPVKPGYTGPITIRGLVTDANVKITDITGALVYETTALGGEATWNGRNFSGREANSGVYLVFITNSDGSQTAMTKILIVR